MSYHPQGKTCTISIRARESQRDLIDKAANLTNKSRSDFILEIACTEAQNILLDRRLFFVDDTAYHSFLKKLEAPIIENILLRKLLE